MDGIWLIVTALIAFGVTAVSGIWLVPYLRRLKYGQTILDIGPKWHKNKQGTPTMGGLMFIMGILVAVAVGYITAVVSQDWVSHPEYVGAGERVFYGMVMALLFGALGFLDDYIKVARKRNMGHTAKQKLFFQIAIAVIYLAGLWSAGVSSTVVIVPFLGQIDLGLLYYPLAAVVIVGAVNAVNLTDGIDGLAASVTFVAAVAFMVIASLLRLWEMNIVATALAAGCVGFLVWNFYPAKVFMGDTGSLFLGGVICALAFGTGLPVFLALIGIVYVVEALSDILQVAYFKSTGGKRLFKMAPIHHHFELSGWSEKKIVAVFSAVTALGGGAAVWAVVLLLR